MNQFSLSFEDAAYHQGQPFLAKLQVDGDYITTGDYFIDFDTFFQALAGEASSFNLVGGCGDFGCCGRNVQSQETPDGWILQFGEKRYHVSWSHATDAAKEVILRLMADRELARELALNIQEYKRQLTQAEQHLQ